MSIGLNEVNREEREKHAASVAEYLAKGGKIKQIPPGVSGDGKHGMTLKEMVELDKTRGRAAKQAKGGQRSAGWTKRVMK